MVDNCLIIVGYFKISALLFCDFVSKIKLVNRSKLLQAQY